MSVPDLISLATIPSGSTLSNVVEIREGFVYGLWCPDHNATRLWIRTGDSGLKQMERLHFLDGSGPYSIVTSGSACAIALEGLSPFSYVQVESNMSMSNNTNFRIISKAWERKS